MMAFMKRVISSTMAILVVVSLYGCYNETDSVNRAWVSFTEGHYYIEYDGKQYSRFDKTGRVIEQEWIFPEQAYSFDGVVPAFFKVEPNDSCGKIQINSDLNYAMLIRYNSQIYCDTEYLPVSPESAKIKQVFILPKLENYSKARTFEGFSESYIIDEVVRTSLNTDDVQKMQQDETSYEEVAIILTEFEDVSALLYYGTLQITPDNSYVICCLENDYGDNYLPISEKTRAILMKRLKWLQ